MGRTFTLTDATAGRTWNYDSERQLRTVTRLYAVQHPKASLVVAVDGKTVWSR